MEFRKSLIIAKYLIKESIINPIFKKGKKILIIFAILTIFSASLILIISIMEFDKNIADEQKNQIELGALIRGVLHSIGLDKYKIIDIISTLLFLYCILIIFKGGKFLVRSEAEYELILSQPISIDSYIIGNTIFNIVFGLPFSIFYFVFIPFAMDINGGNVKAFFIPLSTAITFFVFGGIINNTIVVFNSALDKKGLRNIMRLILPIYLIVSILHSIIIHYFSPLLTLPLRCFSELLIYPLTIAETIHDIMLSLFKAICIITLMFIILIWSSNYITPDDITSLSSVFLQRRIRIYKKSRVSNFKFTSPQTAVRTYILISSIFNNRHILYLITATVSTMAILYIIKWILMNIWPEFLGSIQGGFLTTVMLPIFVLVAFSVIIQSVLINDIQAFWIYRIYLINMKMVAENLLLKYIIIFMEVLLIMACADIILTENILFILFPLTMMPTLVITGFLVLAATLYFASKRKFIKQMPTGMTMLEELLASILLIIIFSLVIMSKVSFVMLISLLEPYILLLSTTLSIIISIALYIIFSMLLAGIAQKYDIIS